MWQPPMLVSQTWSSDRAVNDLHSSLPARSSARTPLSVPHGGGADGCFGDEVRQFGSLRDGERNIGAASAGSRSAVRLDRQVSVREEPDVESVERELHATTGVGPAERIWNRDVDGKGADVGCVVEAHGGQALTSTFAPGSTPRGDRASFARTTGWSLPAGRAAFQC